jgi:hypothetical protein
METYKNPFDKKKDFMLWELHEIRHELHKEFNKKTVEEINSEALKKYQSWQKYLNENER